MPPKAKVTWKIKTIIEDLSREVFSELQKQGVKKELEPNGLWSEDANRFLDEVTENLAIRIAVRVGKSEVLAANGKGRM